MGFFVKPSLILAPLALALLTPYMDLPLAISVPLAFLSTPWQPEQRLDIVQLAPNIQSRRIFVLMILNLRWPVIGLIGMFSERRWSSCCLMVTNLP